MMIGYQTSEDWMGEQVHTLADIWPDAPRAMIVGLNPAPTSVAAGHYYQGASGRRQLLRLAAARVFSAPDDGRFEAPALAAGVGFTDIVKRPTTGESGVSAAEIQHGRKILVHELASRRVPLVICVFRHPVAALLGTEGRPGMQSERAAWGGSIFRMPGPFAPASQVRDVMAELQRFWESDRAV
jgi:double-stranded uracil-DNA glycosylase